MAPRLAGCVPGAPAGKAGAVRMDLQSLAIYGALAPILFRLGKSARKR